MATSPNLTQIATGSSNQETRVNELLRAVGAAGIFGIKAISALSLDLYGGRYNTVDVADTDVDAISLTASSTNYVVVHRTTGAVTVSTATTNWNNSSTYARLYEIDTNGSGVTDIVDARLDTGGLLNSGSGSSGASTTQTGEMISGYIGTVADKTYKVVVKAAHGGTITETTTISESGTVTATFKINTTALGGTANSVSTSEQSQAQASANVFAAGDDIQITTSSNSACIGMSFTIKYTRTLS